MNQSIVMPLVATTVMCVLSYAAQCVRSEPVLDNGSSRVCDQLKLSVATVSMTDAVVDLGPAPQERVKILLEVGEVSPVPDQTFVDSGKPDQWTRVPIINLQPGKEYEVKIVAGNEQCPPLRFTTKQSAGHKCEMFNDSDFEGHDELYSYTSDVTSENAEQCCDLCAKVEVLLPYWNPCMHWVYEESTKKCWFKDWHAMQGRKHRNGFTAGRVSLV